MKRNFILASMLMVFVGVAVSENISFSLTPHDKPQHHKDTVIKILGKVPGAVQFSHEEEESVARGWEKIYEVDEDIDLHVTCVITAGDPTILRDALDVETERFNYYSDMLWQGGASKDPDGEKFYVFTRTFIYPTPSQSPIIWRLVYSENNIVSICGGTAVYNPKEKS